MAVRRVTGLCLVADVAILNCEIGEGASGVGFCSVSRELEG